MSQVNPELQERELQVLMAIVQKQMLYSKGKQRELLGQILNRLMAQHDDWYAWRQSHADE